MKKHFVFVIISLLCMSYSQAAIRLELTRGIMGAIPMAVVPFSSGESQEDLSAVVARDLRYSGRISPIDTQDLRDLPHSVRDVKYDYWQKQRVDYVLVGKIDALPDHQFKVDFALVNVFESERTQLKDKKTQALDQTRILLHQVLTVKAHSLRRLAHHISDLVYEKLTGERGIFSTKIAYVQVIRHSGKPTIHRLLVADSDGHNPRLILESPLPIMSPAWSPDGRTIAYVSFEAKRARIYLSDVRTGRRRLLTSFPGINGAPAWSPDGKQLAVVLSKDGNRGHPKLYLVNLGDLKITQVTKGNAIDTEPSWTADGRSLVFTSNRGGTPQIYLLTLADKQIQRLTFDGDYNARASFSRDGHYLLMLHREQGQFNIALMNMKSGNLRLLTHTVANESPSFAPNGRMVVFATNEGAYTSLGIASIDGRVMLRLPATEGNVQSPAWSPYLLWG